MLGNAKHARLIGGALVATMVIGSAVGAEAATKKKVVRHTRTVTLTYNGGCTIETPAVTGNDSDVCHAFGGGDWEQTAKAGEKYVSIKVTDASGRNVPGQFWVKGTTLHDTPIPFCGALKDFQFPSAAIQVDLDALGGTSKCPGVATSGTVTLVFSNLP